MLLDYLKGGKMSKKQKQIRGLLPFGFLILLYIIFKLLQPERFGNWNSMYVLLQQALIHSILSCGFYYLLIMNIYDLTLGVNAILCSMIGVLLSQRIGLPGLIIGALVCGIAIAMLSSTLMVNIDAPPIIISVGLVIIYEALTVLCCDGNMCLTLDPAYRVLGKPPVNLLPGVLVLVVNSFVMKYTKLGVYVDAIGANAGIASSAGVDVKRYKAMAFLACGICVGIYAISSLSYSASVASATGLSSVTSIFKPFMACMFAVAFKKYLNPMLGLFVGSFILNIIANGLMTNGLEAALQNVVVGFAMIILVRFSSTARKFDVEK